MEEDRPLVVGAVVLRCLTTGIVRPGDFETIPEHGCRMSPRARQAFLAACERRMLTCSATGPRRGGCPAGAGLGLQARTLARTILDPGRPCRPVRWK